MLLEVVLKIRTCPNEPNLLSAKDMKTPWSVRSDDDPLNEFDGGKFWMSCLEAELRILEEKYGKKVGRKHMWVGIYPQCKDT